jgi:hypothetical protein
MTERRLLRKEKPERKKAELLRKRKRERTAEKERKKHVRK